MFQAQLILSGSPKERLKKAYKIIAEAFGFSLTAKQTHPDLIIVKPAPSLGIQQIRILQQKIAFKPYLAPVKVALVTEAEKLTIPAQNAFLKTLEEPPANTLIILLASIKETLLSTVVSRCQITQLPQKPQIKINESLISQHLDLVILVLSSGVGERLKQTQKFVSRQEALGLVKNLLWIWRDLLLVKTRAKKGKTEQKLKLLGLPQIRAAINNTEMTRIMLEANVNPRLGIENLFFSYPSSPG